MTILVALGPLPVPHVRAGTNSVLEYDRSCTSLKDVMTSVVRASKRGGETRVLLLFDVLTFTPLPDRSAYVTPTSYAEDLPQWMDELDGLATAAAELELQVALTDGHDPISVRATDWRDAFLARISELSDESIRTDAWPTADRLLRRHLPSSSKTSSLVVYVTGRPPVGAWMFEEAERGLDTASRRRLRRLREQFGGRDEYWDPELRDVPTILRHLVSEFSVQTPPSAGAVVAG